MLDKVILAFLRRARTRLTLLGKGKYLTYGTDLHIGKAARIWAPHKIVIGNNVYIGKHVHIECNCTIGDYALIANRVALIGRNDHDFRAVGIPMRFAPWAGDSKSGAENEQKQEIIIESDVWIGYGTILLSGIRIGKGALIGAGSVVINDVQPYSIVAGNPAKAISTRFDDKTIEEHEARIKTGRYIFSEKGYEYWTVEPGKSPK